MSSIIIREKNLETTASNTDFTDIAYVPGFGDVEAKRASEVAENTPIYIRSVSELEDYFGLQPQVLQGNYANSNFKSGTVKTSGNYFSTGDADPGYIFAKELLLSGMPIYYERVNSSSTDITPENMYAKFLGTKPNDPQNINKITIASADWQGTGIKTCTKALTISDSAKLKDENSAITSKIVATNFSIKSGGFDASSNISVVLKPQYNLTALTGYNIEFSIAENVTPTSVVEVTGTVTTLSTSSEGESIFEKLKDRGTYNIKYITTGGYPVYGHSVTAILEKLKNCVTPKNDEEGTYSEESNVITGRADAVVLLDYPNYKDRALIGEGSVFEEVQQDSTLFKDFGTYAALFMPWCNINLKNSYTLNNISYSTFDAPASLLYLIKTGQAVQANLLWNSIAGTTRGVVENRINEVLSKTVTATIANTFQSNTVNKRSINAITEVNPYGQTIMGIRTLATNEASETSSNTANITANNILNLRLLISDIKKQVYKAAKTLMFEQNSDVLWTRFQNQVIPVLERMKSNNGIQGYTMSKIKADNKRQLKAIIEIVPIYPVEEFDITISITDSDVTVQ